MTVSAETRFAQSADGTRIAYQIYGTGSVDLLWTGAGGPTELLWDEPGFTRLAARLGTFSRTLWPNLRGWGASEGDPRVSIDWGIANEEDLVAVLDAEGVEQAALVGWSTVGAHVLRFAVAHPTRVRALVLVDSCAHYVREDDYPWGYPRDHLDRVAAFLEDAWGNAQDVEGTVPSRRSDDQFRTWWSHLRRATMGPERYAAGFRASIEADVRSLLPSIIVPTLVLHREGDRFVHLGAGRYLADHIEGARFVVLPGDEHLYFAGDTDALVDEIEEFLTGSRSGAESDVTMMAVLFTDIVGSTDHQARVGRREWSRLTDQHDAIVRALLARYGGHEVKTIGGCLPGDL